MSADRFPARLKELRTQAGLTQQQLADLSGMTVGAIRALEQGANGPTWATILALAKVLGVSCEAFNEEPADGSASLQKPGRPRKPAAEAGQDATEEKPARKKRK